ncbi:MAG: hypothetical protein AAGG38_10845 [Planctomycetota bacterium]
MSTSLAPTYTPPDLAKAEGVKPTKVLDEIRAGRLEAHDVSSKPGVGRPRYRITLEAIERWRKLRAAVPPATPAGRARRRFTPPTRQWV